MKNKKESSKISASSMADIAFLLLIFFLVSTKISTEKGLPMPLIPKTEQEIQPTPVLDRNIYRIAINSDNEILFESEKNGKISDIREVVKKHINNFGKETDYSQNPKKAVVVLSSQRQTDYAFYLNVLDEIKVAYHQARADFLSNKLGTPYSTLEVADVCLQKTPEERELYALLQKEFPINIAEQMEK